MNPDAALTNPNDLSKSIIDQNLAKYIYTPLANSTRWALAGIIALCLAISFFWKEPIYEIYQDSPPLKTTRQEVIKTASDYLVQNHFNLTGYTAVATCNNAVSQHQTEFQYMLEKASFAKADEIAHKIEHPHLWAVRFFKPACPEEYNVTVDENDKIVSQTITKDEDAVGAKLTEPQARKIAEDYLHKYRSVYEPFVFSDVEVKTRAHRTDYYFQFKSPNYKVADADLLVSIEVLGDIPSYEGHRWKIPDEWTWNKSKVTMPKALAMIIASVLSLLCFIALIWWTVSLFLSRIIHWRSAILPALIFITFATILAINFTPLSLFSLIALQFLCPFI